jgi:hypothetical protein
MREVAMTTTGGRLLTAGALGAAIVLTTGLGVATAANGGSLVLGADNTATRTKTLIDKERVPLSLVTGKS